MGDVIELDPVDTLGAGAIGRPGERSFFIQAGKDGARLTVLVEKEQVALLATEAVAFLDRLADDFPDEGVEPDVAEADVHEPAIPLFRARMIGIGFEPDRRLVLLELRENSDEDEEEEDDDAGEADVDDDGFVARIYATRSQVRAMAARGAAAVAAGRPTCPLCEQPMDPSGHRCPRWN
jgi:uncharacterized repeat protein (TIGR03847 family)